MRRPYSFDADLLVITGTDYSGLETAGAEASTTTTPAQGTTTTASNTEPPSTFTTSTTSTTLGVVPHSPEGVRC